MRETSDEGSGRGGGRRARWGPEAAGAGCGVSSRGTGSERAWGSRVGRGGRGGSQLQVGRQAARGRGGHSCRLRRGEVSPANGGGGGDGDAAHEASFPWGGE